MKTIYEMTAADLRVITRDKHMPGAWKATKAEMIAFLESIDYSQEPQESPELTEQTQTNNYKTKDVGASERNVEADYTITTNKGVVIAEVHHEDITQESQNESELTEESKSNKLLDEEEKPIERNQKSYGAWVVDRETKELTAVVGEASSREDFYLSIKGQYRVRLITKPEKLENACKQWEIKHAQNKIKKNEKYAHDKIEAAKLNMNVAEYRKWLRESANN